MPQKVVDLGTPCRPSAGAPKPSNVITRIVGTPRKKAAYTTASARNGKDAGPGRLLTTATPSASTRISASEMQKISTFRRNADAIPGNVLVNSCPSKNWVLIASQPGALTIAKPRPVKT